LLTNGVGREIEADGCWFRSAGAETSSTASRRGLVGSRWDAAAGRESNRVRGGRRGQRQLAANGEGEGGAEWEKGDLLLKTLPFRSFQTIQFMSMVMEAIVFRLEEVTEVHHDLTVRSEVHSCVRMEGSPSQSLAKNPKPLGEPTMGKKVCRGLFSLLAKRAKGHNCSNRFCKGGRPTKAYCG
jgi:hypothetical protein